MNYTKKFTEYGMRQGTEKSGTSLGVYYNVPEESGSGYLWIYTLADQYSIKIHNFSFKEDVLTDFPGHEGLSVCYYYSVSGEELDPYRRIPVGKVRFLNYIDYHFKALIHKNIPIQTVEIELYHSYYEKYLSDTFGDVNIDFDKLFRSIEWCTDFPEMEHLLNEIWNYHGEGLSAKLFYDSAVSKAISLIIDYNQKKNAPAAVKTIAPEDRHAIEVVNSYINDHFSGDVSIDRLCKIACMGKTKFKSVFKNVNQRTVTEYVEEKRLSQAESLLATTNLPIKQVAWIVGYSNPSRFSAIFRESTGLFPSEFRKYKKSSEPEEK